jgi:hypothetical protein
MPVVDVGVMRMGVDQRGMHVCVGVGFATIPREIVIVAVVLVMGMSVAVFLVLIGVQMTMLLGDVQPHPQRHQDARAEELPRHGLAR